MSAREACKFQDSFDLLIASMNLTPALVAANAAMQANLLRLFNRSYKRAYTKRSWEDAWRGATLTPTNRLIGYDQVSDARKFEVWDADPRDIANNAADVSFTTSYAGITIGDDLTSVFVLYMEKEPTFTMTAYSAVTAYTVGQRVLATDRNVYRCIQAGTNQEPSASPAYWSVVPVLAILEDIAVMHAHGTYWLENGRPAEGAAERDDALAMLDHIARDEYVRTAANPWKPKY